MALTGKTLKKWYVGDKLGEGAFGSVYEVFDVKELHKNREERKHYAMKTAKIAGGKKKRGKIQDSQAAISLSHERTVYVQWLNGVPGTPEVDPLNCQGDCDGYRYLVIEKLGPSLEKIVEKSNDIPYEAISTIARQTLEFLKIFHQKGWVYVDMKPENIMLGLPGSGKENRSFVVDFGCAMRYRGFDAAEGGQANGTPNYISIFAHNGGKKHPRNDLQSLAFVLIDLCTGSLPWKNMSDETELIKCKQQTPVSQLTKDVPKGLAEYTKKVYNFDLEDEINHDELINLFSEDPTALGELQSSSRAQPSSAKEMSSLKEQTPKRGNGDDVVKGKKKAKQPEGKPSSRKPKKKQPVPEEKSCIDLSNDDPDEKLQEKHLNTLNKVDWKKSPAKRIQRNSQEEEMSQKLCISRRAKRVCSYVESSDESDEDVSMISSPVFSRNHRHKRQRSCDPKDATAAVYRTNHSISEDSEDTEEEVVPARRKEGQRLKSQNRQAGVLTPRKDENARLSRDGETGVCEPFEKRTCRKLPSRAPSTLSSLKDTVDGTTSATPKTKRKMPGSRVRRTPNASYSKRPSKVGTPKVDSDEDEGFYSPDEGLEEDGEENISHDNEHINIPLSKRVYESGQKLFQAFGL